MTHRRKFIVLLGSAAASGFLRPLTVRAQQRLPRVGIIDNTPMWDPFRQALRELGYIEGRSIAFEYRESTGTPAGLTAAVGELVQQSVDVIATYGTVGAVRNIRVRPLTADEKKVAKKSSSIVDLMSGERNTNRSPSRAA